MGALPTVKTISPFSSLLGEQSLDKAEAAGAEPARATISEYSLEARHKHGVLDDADASSATLTNYPPVAEID